MRCKYCDGTVRKGAKFCGSCGKENVEVDDIKENDDVNQDTSKDIKYVGDSASSKGIKYTDDITSSKDVEYAEDVASSKGIVYKEDVNKTTNSEIRYAEEKNYSKNPCSLIAFISFVVAIVLLWFLPLVSIPVGILSLVLAIVGKKHTVKWFGTFSLVFSIIGFIISLICGPLLFIGNMTMNINSQEITLFDYAKGAFLAGYHEDNLYDSWKIADSEQLFVLKESGAYYLYLDKGDRENNYYYGTAYVSTGVDLSNGDTLYSDKDYFYYTLKASNPKYFESTEEYVDDEIFDENIIIKVRRNDFSRSVFMDKGLEYEFSMKKVTF